MPPSPSNPLSVTISFLSLGECQEGHSGSLGHSWIMRNPLYFSSHPRSYISVIKGLNFHITALILFEVETHLSLGLQEVTARGGQGRPGELCLWCTTSCFWALSYSSHLLPTVSEPISMGGGWGGGRRSEERKGIIWLVLKWADVCVLCIWQGVFEADTSSWQTSVHYLKTAHPPSPNHWGV